MIVLGIDPGTLGGMASISDEGHLMTIPMPVTETGVYEWIYGSNATWAWIEPAQSYPGAGVSGMFTYGCGYGFIRGVLISLRIPFEEVRPQRWQPVFVPSKAKCPRPSKNASKEELLAWKRAVEAAKRDHKHRLLEKAQQIFPGVKLTLKTADSVLIAEYGRRELIKRLLPSRAS